MTEIPEHLLKRAQAARAKAAGEDAPSDAAGAASPATTGAAAPAAAPKAAAPAKAAPVVKPPKVDPAYVKAAKNRKRMPAWAMGALSIMPVWGFMYIRGMQPDPVVASGPLAEGAEIYSGCAGCHGARGDGSGGGRVFADGEVLKTFPAIEDQLNFVYLGTDGYDGQPYGNPDREGGAHTGRSLGNMPAQKGQLTDAQILAVVCHERYAVGGAQEFVDDGDERWTLEFETWCSEEAPLWLELEEGATFEEIDGVGHEARPGMDEEQAEEALASHSGG